LNQDAAVGGLHTHQQKCPHEIQEEDLATLSKENVNGRQIKNIIKAAELLSLQDKEPLKMEHLKIVMGIMRTSRSLISRTE
jgi:hypothetical protein